MPWRNRVLEQKQTLYHALKRRWDEARDVAYYSRFDKNLTEREHQLWSNRLLVFVILVGLDILTDEEDNIG